MTTTATPRPVPASTPASAPSATDVQRQVQGWQHTNLGMIDWKGRRDAPLHAAYADTRGRAHPLPGVKTVDDAVQATIELRKQPYTGPGSDSIYGPPLGHAESAVLQAADGAYYVIERLDDMTGSSSPSWAFPDGPNNQSVRDRSIDTVGWISRRPTAHVTKAHEDLRALVGWKYTALIDGDREGSPVPNAVFTD